MKSFNTEQQFDIIATNVNNTLHELNRIYNLIGYSEPEISEKKSEIFQVIQETITSFTNNLQREKNNIENECEWLRQQIRIILSMLNDGKGEKTLKLSSRGIVFDDPIMYQTGYNDDVMQQMHLYQKHTPFYAYSPFNMGNSLPSDDFSMQQQLEYIVNHSPKLSLLEFKTRLNSIFLEVLKAFVKVFRKFNEQNVMFWENMDTIGDCRPPNSNQALLNSLPSKAEAEEHSRLIEEFESTIKKLKLTDKNVQPEIKGRSGDEFAFIISSPRKANKEAQEEETQSTPESSQADVDDTMDQLRDVNYKIVRALRSLKVTKITPEVSQSLSKEVELTETELLRRKANMTEIIGRCLSLISALSLNERDVISIQKMQDMTNGPNVSSEGYFDVETLRFIETDPREFGLMDHHLSFISKLAHTLQSIKDAKQKKWDYYSNACVSLWEKLGENREYVQQFLDVNSSLTDMSLTNLKMELNRLYLKRSEFIESFIMDARKEIKRVHEALLYSSSQRMDFKYASYDVNDDTDDKETVLSEHEAELDRLKAEFQSKEAVLGLFSQLNELLADQKFLTESSKDSSRLLSKNSCKILLNEEKIRKKINKNLPRVIENLKQEVVKFNNEQLSQGNRPFMIDGEDFFERLLVIESDVGNQSVNKFSRGRNVRPTTSPRKARVLQSRTSPVKTSVVRSPSKVTKSSPKRVTSGNDKKPVLTRTHNTVFDSPPKGHSKFASASFFGLAQLQPLNSPLAAGSVYSDTSLDTRPESRADSTLYSMCSRVSPLKSGNQCNIKTNFSPIKGYDLVDISDSEDKENRSNFNTKYGLSPIRVVSNERERRLSTNSLANSTIIGDDYQLWREERIREINGRT